MAVCPIDHEHGTTAWLSFSRDWAGAKNANRLRRLLVEINAPHYYYEAIDPATDGQRRRRERDLAISETLSAFYGGPAGSKTFAKDWQRYLSVAFPRDRDKPSLPANERSLRVALHRLSRLTDGECLSVAQISRIAAQTIEKT